MKNVKFIEPAKLGSTPFDGIYLHVKTAMLRINANLCHKLDISNESTYIKLGIEKFNNQILLWVRSMETYKRDCLKGYMSKNGAVYGSKNLIQELSKIYSINENSIRFQYTGETDKDNEGNVYHKFILEQ